MPKVGWKDTVVRSELYTEVQQLIAEDKRPKSVSEFVNQAIREKLKREKKAQQGSNSLRAISPADPFDGGSSIE